MSFTGLIPLPWRLLALAAFAAALVGFGWVKGAEHGQDKLDAYQAQQLQAVDAQRDRNRAAARSAEQGYVDRAPVRERFIVTTVKEIHHETDNLAACVLTDGAVRRLRAAAECAREDRPAACGAGEQVRNP